jgi:hypothetical protein
LTLILTLVLRGGAGAEAGKTCEGDNGEDDGTEKGYARD